MSEQWWSWILTAVGLTGFILAGRKVWWSWYINLACQSLWLIYALVTNQYGFIVAALVYTVVFSQNAYKWTKEHLEKKCQSCKHTRGLIHRMRLFSATRAQIKHCPKCGRQYAWPLPRQEIIDDCE